MGKNLVIVESPAKAKTIEGFLGKVAVPEKDIDEVIAAAEQCPGMCIYVHVDAEAEMSASS